ncbi:MAG: COX15/CtaA family protein [Saprospiraceae bacterium]|nr:COX15/CtaA family protein [Saprospiraceae bacterium]
MTNDTHQDTKSLRRFRRWATMTVLSTVFLIWVGGWVRSTGSGMGCPDWPKCFGVWIPPTSEAALPADYLEHYGEQRLKKNQRVAKTLTKLGFNDLAYLIQNDPSIFVHEPFNAYKTWTEYLNRVIGVLVGFFIFLTLVFSIATRKIDKRLFWLSLFAFLGVGFEGWLGSLVVSTNLMPSFITVHMVLAMAILMALISAVIIAYIRESSDSEIKNFTISRNLILGGTVVCGLVLIQIIIGTQVRENVDIVKATLGDNHRQEIIGGLDSVYMIHRLFYYVLAAAVLFFAYLLRGGGKSEKTYFSVQGVRFSTNLMVVSLLTEIGLGISMHNFGLPPVLQPLHLLFATLLFSSAYMTTSFLWFKKT